MCSAQNIDHQLRIMQLQSAKKMHGEEEKNRVVSLPYVKYGSFALWMQFQLYRISFNDVVIEQ